VLRAALHADPAARDEESRALNVAPGGGLPGRSVARHAKPPEVLGARVAE
jgi:hypothetical protein